jgi:hypothetical protein
MQEMGAEGEVKSREMGSCRLGDEPTPYNNKQN